MSNLIDLARAKATRSAEPDPASAVMRVAPRVSSSTSIVSPIEIYRRAYRDLTDGAAKAYEQAAVARRAGDLVGAALLLSAAAQALGEAQAVGEELARL